MLCRAAIRNGARLVVRRSFSSAPAVVSSSRKHVALGMLAFGAAAACVAEPRKTPTQCSAKFAYTGVPGTANERSFIAIKPDGVQRGLVGEIISRFEKKGYKLVALKMIWPTEEKAAQHYDDLKSKPFFPALVKYFASGPIIAMCWEGPDVILTGRKILGATNPSASDIGTLRGDYCLTMGRNMIHGSDSSDSAKHEIGMWFTEEECSAWPRNLDEWIIANN